MYETSMFTPIASFILMVALFFSRYKLKYRIDDDPVDETELRKMYEIKELWEKLEDTKPSEDTMNNLINKEMEFSTRHGPVYMCYDYANSTFNYWTKNKDIITYDMLESKAREYSLSMGIKCIFIEERASVQSSIAPSHLTSDVFRKPVRPKPVRLSKIKLNTFKFKGKPTDKDVCVEYSMQDVSWNDWKTKKL